MFYLYTLHNNVLPFQVQDRMVKLMFAQTLNLSLLPTKFPRLGTCNRLNIKKYTLTIHARPVLIQILAMNLSYFRFYQLNLDAMTMHR